MKTIFKFLPMIAIVAALGLSAFTSAKPVAKGKFVNYFWYQVNASGVTQSAALNPSTSVDKANAMANLTECEDDQTRPYCLLGSPSNSLPTGTTITPAESGAIIRNNPQP